MNEDNKMTAEEWHEMAAETLAKKNKELLEGFLSQISKNETEHYECNLRDSIACSAMNGTLSFNPVETVENIAILSYQIADAMLKARKGQN